MTLLTFCILGWFQFLVCFLFVYVYLYFLCPQEKCLNMSIKVNLFLRHLFFDVVVCIRVGTPLKCFLYYSFIFCY